jgi:hypothetical protein
VRVPWLIWIVLWHALFSVVTPVLLVEQAFPAHAGRPWLPPKVTWALAILSIVSGVGYFLFLGEDRLAHATPTLLAHLGVILAAGAGFWLLARWLPRIVPRSAHWRCFSPAPGYLAFTSPSSPSALIARHGWPSRRSAPASPARCMTLWRMGFR